MEELILRFIGYDLMSNVIGGIGNSIDELGKKSDANAGRFSQTWQNVTQTAGHLAIVFGTIFAAFGAGALYAVTQAATFDQSILRLWTHGSALQSQLAGLRTGVLAISDATGVAATELAGSAYWITSEGLAAGDTAKQLDILRVASQTAAMTGADVSGTTKTLSMLLKSGLLPMTNLTSAAGQLNEVISRGVLTGEDLTTAFRTGLIPAAVNAHISFSNMGAALDILTRVTGSASVSATGLRNEIIRLAVGGPAAEKALNSIGLSHQKLTQEMAKGDLLGALQMLHDHLKNLDAHAQEDIIFKVFGGTRGTSAMLTLMHNLQDMPGIVNDISTAGGKFNDQWTAYVNSVKGQLSILHQSFHNIVITIGEALTPGFDKLLHAINPVLDAFNTWGQQNPALLGQILSTAIGVTGIATAALGLTAIVGRIGPLLFDPLTLGFAAIILASYEVLTHWQDISNFVGGFAGRVESAFSQIRDAVMIAFGGGNMKPLTDAVGGLLGAFQNLGSGIKTSFGDPLTGLLTFIIGQVIPGLVTFANNVGTNVVTPLSHLVTVISADVVPKFQEMVTWIREHIVPAAQTLATWLGNTVPSAIGHLITIVENVVRAFDPVLSLFIHIGEAIGGALIPFVVGLATTLGGVLAGAIGFLSDHSWILVAVLDVLIARFAALAAGALVRWFITIQPLIAMAALVFSNLGTVISAAAAGMPGLIAGFFGISSSSTAATVSESDFAAVLAMTSPEFLAASAGADTFAASLDALIPAEEAEGMALSTMLGPISAVVAVVTLAVTVITQLAGANNDAATAAKNNQDAINGLHAATDRFNGVMAGNRDYITQTTNALQAQVNQITAIQQRTNSTNFDPLKHQLEGVITGFSSMSRASQAVVSGLADNMPALLTYMDALHKANGDNAVALNNLASTGSELWIQTKTQVDDYLKHNVNDAAGVKKAWDEVYASLGNSAVSAWDNISATYGAGSAQANAALSLLTGAQQDVIRDLRIMSFQSGLSVDALAQLGAQGTIAPMKVNLNGTIITVHGSLSDVVTQIDLVLGALGQVGPPQGLDNLSSALYVAANHASDLAHNLGNVNAAGVGSRPTHLQSGGPMNPWETHMVGEAGPELFMSPVGGRIVSGHDLASLFGPSHRDSQHQQGGGDGGASAVYLSQLVDIQRRALARMEMDTQPTNHVENRQAGIGSHSLLNNMVGAASRQRARGVRGSFV